MAADPSELICAYAGGRGGGGVETEKGDTRYRRGGEGSGCEIRGLIEV